MSLAANTRASRPRLSPRLLLLWLLLLPAPADPEGGGANLRCVCVKTTSGVSPRQISSLEVIGAGLHCPSPQLM
uniref:Uncharacterized protein n=1 Tax=Catagonus wagneri TaxID=51154 RepID=A0A8C3XBG4_9CETA